MSRSVWIVLIVCLLGGIYQTSGQIVDWMSPRPPSPAASDVVVYTNSWCDYCAQTRKLLAEHEVQYAEYDVEKSLEGRAAYDRYGGGAVPIVVIGERTVIRGFRPKEILAALGR